MHSSSQGLGIRQLPGRLPACLPEVLFLLRCIHRGACLYSSVSILLVSFGSSTSVSVCHLRSLCTCLHLCTFWRTSQTRRATAPACTYTPHRDPLFVLYLSCFSRHIVSFSSRSFSSSPQTRWRILISRRMSRSPCTVREICTAQT